jgi:hypothetical protein
MESSRSRPPRESIQSYCSSCEEGSGNQFLMTSDVRVYWRVGSTCRGDECVVHVADLARGMVENLGQVGASSLDFTLHYQDKIFVELLVDKNTTLFYNTFLAELG